MTAIHQKFTSFITSFTPCQNGVRSDEALVDGGVLGFSGTKKAGIVQIVDTLATIISCNNVV